MFRLNLASRILGIQNKRLFHVRKCAFSELKEENKNIINTFQDYKSIDKQKSVVVEEKESFLEDVQEFRDKKIQRRKEWKIAFIIAFMYLNIFYCKEVLLFYNLRNKPWSY
ncbi:hypothetical protein ABPG72_017819 [Tetrahymena utriculariae]